jgi:hypothetical protein
MLYFLLLFFLSYIYRFGFSFSIMFPKYLNSETAANSLFRSVRSTCISSTMSCPLHHRGQPTSLLPTTRDGSRVTADNVDFYWPLISSATWTKSFIQLMLAESRKYHAVQLYDVIRSLSETNRVCLFCLTMLSGCCIILALNVVGSQSWKGDGLDWNGRGLF